MLPLAVVAVLAVSLAVTVAAARCRENRLQRRQCAEVTVLRFYILNNRITEVTEQIDRLVADVARVKGLIPSVLSAVTRVTTHVYDCAADSEAVDEACKDLEVMADQLAAVITTEAEPVEAKPVEGVTSDGTIIPDVPDDAPPVDGQE